MAKKQPSKELAKKLIRAVDKATELVEQIYSYENKSEYNRKMRRLGGSINALAIECRLANEENPPYTAGMLAWSPSVTIKGARSAMSGLDKAFPEIERLYTLRERAKLIVQADINMARDELANKKPAETEQEIPPAKRRGIKALLKKVAENAWQIFTKSFWETVLERIFGPR